MHSRLGQLLPLFTLAATIAGGATGFLPLTSSGEATNPSQLEVRDLRISPIVLRSGDTVYVDAIIINQGHQPALNLSIGPAIGNATAHQAWRPVKKEPAQPIARLGPGEEVRFRGTVQLKGDGWYLVGVAAMADNAMLRPQGRKVLVLDPVASLIQVGVLLVTYIAVLGLIAAVIRWALRPEGAAPMLVPNYRLLALSVGLMSLGPATLWSLLEQVIIHSGGRAFTSPAVLVGLTWSGLLLFVLGWFLAGAGLRPRGSNRRGLLSSLALYVAAGIIFILTYGVLNLNHAHVDEFFTPGNVLLALLWPLSLSQILGLFGLENL